MVLKEKSEGCEVVKTQWPIILTSFSDALAANLSPVTKNDESFLAKNKNNTNIQREKIKLSETTIEINGLKFPRTIVTYDDIRNTPWLKLDKNVYQNNGHDYFTFDAVKNLEKAGKKIPSEDQWKQAADALGRDWWLLGQLLNYPKAGLRNSNGKRNDIGYVSRLWSSTSSGLFKAYTVWFFTTGSGSGHPDSKRSARSLIFLQD